MTDPTTRTLALLSLLQANRVWRGPDLAARLGVSERTVRRDIDRLRTLGYPVDAGPGVDGGYQLAAGAQLPPLVVDDDEAIALVVGLRAAAITAIEGIQDTTVALMAKVDQVLPDRLRRRVDALATSVEMLSWGAETSLVPAESLTLLSQGCRGREEVRFDYEAGDGALSKRLVQPYQLVSTGRRWYLVGWDVRREDWRTFRLDRIRSPELAGMRFERRELPAQDASTFVKDSIRGLSVEHRATVIVHGPQSEVDAAVHWLHTESQPIDADHTRVEVAAESADWLATNIAYLAVHYDIEVVTASDQVMTHLAATSTRVAACLAS